MNAFFTRCKYKAMAIRSHNMVLRLVNAFSMERVESNGLKLKRILKLSDKNGIYDVICDCSQWRDLFFSSVNKTQTMCIIYTSDTRNEDEGN